MPKYEYLPDDPEISGFGGGYEAACRAMVAAGMEWFDANPDADPKFHGFMNARGVIASENDDAKALSAVLEGVRPVGGATGAMVFTALWHVLYAHKHGWETYLAEWRELPRHKE